MGLLKDILFTVIFILWFSSVHKVQFKSQYNTDKDGRIIFYPLSFNKGYVATTEQIEQCSKSLYKSYLFNFKGFSADIEKIFGESEVVSEPLPRSLVFTNQAKAFSWLQLITLLFICLAMLAFCWQFKILVVMMALISFIYLHMIFIKLKKIEVLSRCLKPF